MRTRRIYWIFSIVILWITCAFLFNYFYKIEKENKIQEIIGHQKIHAHLASKNFEQLFSKWNNVLYYLAKDPNIIKVNDAGKEDMLMLTGFLSEELKGITRTDSVGKIIFTLPQNSRALGRDISKQKHMIQILADHQPVVSDVFQAIQGYQAVVIHYPIFVNGKYNGSIALLLNFEKLTKSILSEIKIGKSGLALMLSRDGIELFCKEKEHVGKPLDISHKDISSVVDSMRSGKEGISSFEVNSQNSRNIAYYLPVRINNTFWSLVIANSENEITASLIDFRNRLLIILAIVFIGGIILSYYGIKAVIIVKESELRQIAENNLIESEEKYRRVVEATDTGYAVTDKDGKILDANMKFALMTGTSSLSKIMGQTLEKNTSPDDYEKYRKLINNCYADNTVHTAEIVFNHANGNKIPVEINACRINLKNLDQVIMLCRNITERIQVKEELIKERTLLRTLIDSLPSGVFIKDINYRKVIANPLHIESVKGHMKRNGRNDNIDIIGKTDFEVFLPEEAKNFLEDEKKIIERGEAIINHVEPGWGPNGEKLWLLVSKVPIKTPEGNILGMVGITTNITDQKKVEEQLIEAKEKAEQSDNLKTAFLNNISHEIRTPLNAIVGFSGLLNDPGLTDEKRESYYQIISQSSNQLLMIISDIINIATIEAGQVKINYSKVAINPIIEILYQQHLASAIFKHLKFGYSKALPDEEAIVETDETKFLEVLSNLISNAIKFTAKGSVSYGYTLQKETLTFFVADTGIGIDSEHYEHIFDRFWRVENNLTKSSRGAGLGLSISKTYVELLGGKIWLESELHKGTTFYFTLPFKK